LRLGAENWKKAETYGKEFNRLHDHVRRTSF
jgi:hypothetical protein